MEPERQDGQLRDEVRHPTALSLAARLRGLRNSRFVRSVSVLMSGTVMASALSTLTLPVVSRLYTPAQFGDFALIASVASIVAALCAFGLQLAVVQAPTETEARDLMRLGLISTTGLVGLALVAALVAGPFWGTWALEVPYKETVLLIAVLAVLTNISSHLQYYANRLGKDRVLFVNAIIGASATVVISIPLGLLGVGSVGLVAGSVGAMLVSAAQMVWRLRVVGGGRRPTDLRAALRSNWLFVWFQYPSDLTVQLLLQMPQQVLAVMFGTPAVGSYSMSMRILGVPLRLLGAPIATVYLRETTQRAQGGEKVGGLTYRLLIRLLAFSYPVIAVLVILGQPLFVFVLGPEWAEAGRLSSILAIPAVFAFCKTSVGTALVVAGRLGVNLVISLARLVVEVSALIIGGTVVGTPLGALAAYAAASTTFHIIDMTITLRIIGGAYRRYLAAALVYGLSLAALAVLGGGLHT